MIYTNKFNLPNYVVAWLEWDSYDYQEGVVSATQLLSPARQYALYKWYNKELKIDVSDVIASRYGTAIHAAFEEVDLPNSYRETRLKYTFKVGDATYLVSGKFDLIIDKDKPVRKLIDLKSTSVWSYIYDSKTEDYVKQLSVYKFLGNKDGMNIGPDAEICMVFTDWSKTKAKQDPGYPQLRIAIKKIRLLDDEETEKFILERLILFKKCIDGKEEDLPDCSQKELWAEDDSWQVIKLNQQRPVCSCATLKEAKEYALLNNLNGKVTIKLQKGKVKRCEYCLARKYCSQYKRLVAENACENFDYQTNLLT